MATAVRVIKNTGFLYIKMGITVFITLYTTRLILSSLGAADFGIFNIVGGAIGMLGFLNSTLANATQRFMSYAEGRGNLLEKKKIFNISISLHLIVAFATAIILFIAMFPFFNGILNIESSRIITAKIVYLCFVFSTILTIINVPYDAVMNAHENMLYYSIISIIESFIKLAIAFTCVYYTGDKLLIYGILMACVPLITLTIMKVYCHCKYEECEIHLYKYWDVKMVKEIASFSGWNFLTAITSLFSYQGINIVLNHFFGTRLNTAQGLASQVKGQLSAFAVTMLKALNPVIVKQAGANNIQEMNKATLAGCKFSTLLILFFAIPFCIEIHYILSLWLVEIPEWTKLFCIMQLIMAVISQMANPIATAVYAQGNIKYYTIWKSITNIAPLFLTAICFLLGGSPIWLYIPMIVVWSLGGNMVVIHYASKYCKLNVNQYFHLVVYPLLIIIIVVLGFSMLPKYLMHESFYRFCLTCIISGIMICVSTWKYILQFEERIHLKHFFLQKLNN